MAIVGTGVNTYAKYGKETSFKSGGTPALVFGHEQKITTFGIENAMALGYGLGDNQAQVSYPGAFKGTLTAEFTLANPWWLSIVAGTTSTVSGTGPYTHVWVDGSTLKPTSAIPSVVVEVGHDLTSDIIRTLKGCILNSAAITCRKEAPVTVSLDFAYADEAFSSSLGTIATETEPAFHFGMASVELPDGTTLSDVQEASITITRNSTLLTSLGSRIASNHFQGNVGYEIRLSVPVEDANLLKRTYGSTSATSPQSTIEETTLDLLIDNGKTGTDNRKLHLTFGGVVLDSYATPVSAGEMVSADVALKARTWTLAEAINNTATNPF